MRFLLREERGSLWGGGSRGSVCRKETKAWVLAHMSGGGGSDDKRIAWKNQRSNVWEAGSGPTAVSCLCQVAQKEAISRTERSMVSTHRRPQSLSMTKWISFICAGIIEISASRKGTSFFLGHYERLDHPKSTNSAFKWNTNYIFKKAVVLLRKTWRYHRPILQYIELEAKKIKKSNFWFIFPSKQNTPKIYIYTS